MNPAPNKGEPLNAADLGGEAREGFRTGDLSGRLTRYGKARENALQFRDWLRNQGEPKLVQALDDCGNYATFREYFTVGQVRLSNFCTCKKHLICPLCAIRRGARALRIYHARIAALMAQNPALRAYMVTLTVRNGPDLKERMAHLQRCLRAYHKRRMGQRQKGEIRKASAAVWSYETTQKGNGWHPHVHAIWLCEEAPDPFRLSEEWQALTGDSFIVDVRPIVGDSVDGCMEVFKYAVKFSDLENSDRLHAYKTLKGKRLTDAFGDLRGLDVEPDEDADQLLEDLPYIERFFAFRRGVGYVEQGARKVAA